MNRPEDLRVQLEGAWEVLERADEARRLLLRRLRSVGWRQSLQRDPGLSRRVCELAGPLAQALDRVERRLRQEPCPECPPLRELIQSLHDQERELETLVRQRLLFWDERGTGTVREGLERLTVRAQGPLDQLPGEAGPVLLTGGVGWWKGGIVLAGVFSGLPFHPDTWLGRAGLFTFLVGVLQASHGFFRRNNRFWLTPRGWVWRTWQGEVKRLPLNALNESRMQVSLLGMRNTRALDELIQLHSRPPFVGADLGTPTHALSVFPALYFPRGFDLSLPSSGLIVLRPGRLFFLYDQGLEVILKEMEMQPMLFHHYGPKPSWSLTLSMLVRQLQLLPAAEFDRILEQIARVREASHWPTSAVLAHGRTMTDRYKFVLPQGGRLVGLPTSAQRESLHRFFQSP